MNPVLQHLAEQAGAIRYETDWKRDAYPVNLDELEKFAELIVQECILLADEFEMHVNQSGLTHRIRNSFGVNK